MGRGAPPAMQLAHDLEKAIHVAATVWPHETPGCLPNGEKEEETKMTTKRALIATGVAAMAAFGLVSVAAYAAPRSQQPPITSTAPAPAAPKLQCVVQGTPVEFPDDIVIRNVGTVVVASGTKIHWSIPGTTRQGDFTFTEALAVGASKMLSGVLPGGHPAGAVCQVTFPGTLQVVPAARVPVQLKPSLTCVVQGTPVEFPDDIVLRNTGMIVVVKGTKVHWAIPATTRQGDYTFTEDLAVGASKMVSGVLPGGHPAGASCTVNVL
jgi:hypothetical protein